MKSLILAGLTGFAVGVPAGAFAADACSEGHVDIRGDFGTARFTVEIADDAAERAQGLMNRDYLPASAGMLFLYPEAGSPSFWMKNTLIPLDMLFVRPDGTIQTVHDSAVPGDLTGINGGTGVIAVLEIKGGLADAIGIEPGDAMRHPAFDGADAVWSCEAE